MSLLKREKVENVDPLVAKLMNHGWNPDVEQTGVKPGFGLEGAKIEAPVQSGMEATMAPGQWERMAPQQARLRTMGMLGNVLLSAPGITEVLPRNVMPVVSNPGRARADLGFGPPARLGPKPTQAIVAAPYYSQLRTVLADPKVQEAQTGEAWTRFLADPKRGVKAEEMQWTGLKDVLAGKVGQKVTREEINKHLDENEVEVKEVTKGGQNKPGKGTVEETDGRFYAYSNNGSFAGEFANRFDAQARADHESLIDFAEGPGGPTKFSQYTLPGAENYREVLLTLPGKPRPDLKYSIRGADGRLVREPRAQTRAEAIEYAGGDPTRVVEISEQADPVNFRSGHWDEPNVLAHLRLSDRKEPDGRRMLLVEEIQSDWAQKGRKEGFALKSEDTAPMDSEYRALVHKNAAAREAGQEPNPADVARAQALEAALERSDKSKIPTAPFVTDTSKWTALSLKRVLKMAADEGYDSIGIVPGVEQAKRYDLSKQIDRLKITPIVDQNGLAYEVKAYKDDNNRVINRVVKESELPDTIGKELADKVVRESEGKKTVEYSGLDLQVGGEGMKGYYDKIVPDTLNKLAKEYGVKVELGGGKVGDSSVRTLDQINADMDANVEEMMKLGHTGERSEALEEKQRKLQEEYNRAKGGEGVTPIHRMEVPESMRKQIKSKGFPLYSRNGAPDPSSQNA